MADPIAPVVTRNAWRDAVWAASDLPPLQLLVALAYADHAGADTTDVWVTLARGLERSHIKDHKTWSKAVAGLVAAGWLVEVQARTNKRAARYRLAIPECASIPLANPGVGSCPTPEWEHVRLQSGKPSHQTPTEPLPEPLLSPSSPDGDGECTPAYIDPKTFGDEYAEAKQIEHQDPECYAAALDAAAATLSEAERDLIAAEDPGDRLHEQHRLHDTLTARTVEAYDSHHAAVNTGTAA